MKLDLERKVKFGCSVSRREISERSGRLHLLRQLNRGKFKSPQRMKRSGQIVYLRILGVNLKA